MENQELVVVPVVKAEVEAIDAAEGAREVDREKNGATPRRVQATAC